MKLCLEKTITFTTLITQNWSILTTRCVVILDAPRLDQENGIKGQQPAFIFHGFCLQYHLFLYEVSATISPYSQQPTRSATKLPYP
ncbi:hypothetical protein O988_06206 [Pseudogymnoascus sp. VKM F-3808]|nr:hypothetical protein O988_06206 [Pseudogymnoascus sp. VKM F-3808]